VNLGTAKYYNYTINDWVYLSTGMRGEQGPAGAQGPQGNAGPGVASGGTDGQYLVKNSSADYDTSWQTITKSSVGLSDVDNTSDANKPISTATQTALDGKEPTLVAGTVQQYLRGDKTWQLLDQNALVASNSPSATTYYRGDGQWVTPTNTTYSGMTQAEAEAGTSTTNRLISPLRLKNTIDFHTTGKQDVITLTTTGTSGPATFIGNTLNIPQYSGGGGGGGITRSVISTSGSYTAGSASSVDYVYLVTGAHAGTLPSASGNTNRYTFKNNHTASITVTRAGSDTVEGATSITIDVGDSVDLISNGVAAWSVI
jgi:hypothetical protein